MKKLLLIPALLFLVSCGGAGDTGFTTTDQNTGTTYPNVAGSYKLTNVFPVGCPFDPVINVAQSGSHVVLAATHSGYADASGTLETDGQFTTTSVNETCDGQFVNGTATATCGNSAGDCQVTYTKQ